MGSGTICVVWGWFYRRAIESANTLVQIWLSIRKMPFFSSSKSHWEILKSPNWKYCNKSIQYEPDPRAPIIWLALHCLGEKKFLFGRGHWVVWQLSHRLTTADQHKVHQHFSDILLPQHFCWCKIFAVYYWILLKKIDVMLNGQKNKQSYLVLYPKAWQKVHDGICSWR